MQTETSKNLLLHRTNKNVHTRPVLFMTPTWWLKINELPEHKVTSGINYISPAF